jgi:hypothetical protein
MSRSLESTSRRRFPYPIAALILAVTSVGLLSSGSAWANNDPHRVFLPSSPFDIADNVCGFVVHVDIPVDKQYGTFSEAPDGSTILKITGSLVWTLTNTTNEKSVTLNVSGPGVVTFPANTSLATIDAHGLNIIYVTNGADFGIPNLFYSSGSLLFTTDLATDTIVSLDRKPHVKLDVCAALA